MSSEINMTDLLQATVDEGSSDLHIRVGVPPMLRIHGHLTPLDSPVLTPDDTEALSRAISSDDKWAEIDRCGGCDFALPFGDLARFRVSVFKERGHFGIVLRQIPNKLLTLAQIGLPDQVQELLFKPRGLILVTGPTGSGKTTTLASMIDIINKERDVHIITVEDPVEYYHPHKKSVVTQREIGHDVPSFAEAIRRALRQDPDVILVGEMRDLETMQAAITAAETGHLVFATLHTTGAAATVDRIVDAFPTDQQEQVRTQLSVGLVAVISQLLLSRVDKPGRVAAFEIMISTPSIRSRIRDNKTFQISSDIQTGAKFGMKTLDSHLLELYLGGLISYDDLVTKSQDPDTLVQKLKDELQARR
jgi:twitching motility protein PilT